MVLHTREGVGVHPCRLSLIDCLNLSEMEPNPENKEKVNSYDNKEIRVSGNNEQQVSAEIDTDEFDKTILQIEPDNSNADQSDDNATNHCLIIPFYRKLKIAWYLLERVETNGNVEQFILELVNKPANIKIGLT